MSRLAEILRARGRSDGGVLVMVALWLPVIILFATLVADVGNWFAHKRHLQMQADAGALAAGGSFTVPCNDTPIIDFARKYAGDPTNAAPFNRQIAPTQQSNVHVLINSSSYFNEGGTDYSDGGMPCAARMVDVKITESSLPWFFGLHVVPAINAHARVRIESLTAMSGALPVAIPDIDPRVARAYFVNESTGAVITSVPLQKTGTGSGMAFWDNAAAPVSLPVGTAAIGVRIALGGGTSTTCGDAMVECYDAGSSNGVDYIRGWSASGSATPPNPPLARSVTLFSGSCPRPYFVAESAACSVGVAATVDFGGVAPAKAKVSAVLGGVEKQLQYDATSGRWISTTGGNSFFAVNPSVGPLPVELKWEVNDTSVTIGGNGCTTTNGNKCKGTFGIVQRTFSASAARSGPLKIVQVWEGGSGDVNSFQQGTTHDLVVKIAVAGNLAVAQAVSDPAVLIRVTGSQNQSVDCDPALPNLREEIRNGCAPQYAINPGFTCPATAPTLWSSPQPWNCVAIQTGGAVGQVEQGLRDRILGGSNSCTSPNNWSSFPNIPTGDPRIVPVFITPFGTFSGSGNDVFPVTNFAVFYVTGWFSSPCPNDDPVPDKGYIVGHFIQYVFALNNGGGSGQLCNFSSFGTCVAVLDE